MSEPIATIRLSMSHDPDSLPSYYEEWIESGDGNVELARKMLDAWKRDEWHFVVLCAETLCEHGGGIDSTSLGEVENGVGYVLPNYTFADEEREHLLAFAGMVHEAFDIELSTTTLPIEIRKDVRY